MSDPRTFRKYQGWLSENKLPALQEWPLISSEVVVFDDRKRPPTLLAKWKARYGDQVAPSDDFLPLWGELPSWIVSMGLRGDGGWEVFRLFADSFDASEDPIRYIPENGIPVIDLTRVPSMRCTVNMRGPPGVPCRSGNSQAYLEWIMQNDDFMNCYKAGQHLCCTHDIVLIMDIKGYLQCVALAHLLGEYMASRGDRRFAVWHLDDKVQGISRLGHRQYEFIEGLFDRLGL